MADPPIEGAGQGLANHLTLGLICGVVTAMGRATLRALPPRRTAEYTEALARVRRV